MQSLSKQQNSRCSTNVEKNTGLQLKYLEKKLIAAEHEIKNISSRADNLAHLINQVALRGTGLNHISRTISLDVLHEAIDGIAFVLDDLLKTMNVIDQNRSCNRWKMITNLSLSKKIKHYRDWVELMNVSVTKLKNKTLLFELKLSKLNSTDVEIGAL